MCVCQRINKCRYALEDSEPEVSRLVTCFLRPSTCTGRGRENVGYLIIIAPPQSVCVCVCACYLCDSMGCCNIYKVSKARLRGGACSRGAGVCGSLSLSISDVSCSVAVRCEDCFLRTNFLPIPLHEKREMLQYKKIPPHTPACVCLFWYARGRIFRSVL